MNDWFAQRLQEIAGRPTGPLAFRFYLQPAIAIFLAVRDGLADARLGKPAYFWAVFTNPENRRVLLLEGWRSIRRVFVLALVMDCVYQALVFRGFRPIEAHFVAALLAIIPYAILRGPVNRIAKAIQGHSSTHRRAA